MTRPIITHQIIGDPASDIQVAALDAPGNGGANHHYGITWGELENGLQEGTELRFQNGPVLEAGHNGLTIESLLAVCADRLARFQEGPYAHKANEQALAHLSLAMEALHERTRERMARRVEGTSGL